MSNLAIRAEGLGKRYRIGTAAKRIKSARDALVHVASAPVRNLARLRRLSSFRDDDEADVIWALRDVSFELEHGDVLGIVGRNGAGKSTLLKILSRITRQTTGRVEMAGRVGSLLEVGTGFHPELTGRDNIYMNGSILGMNKRYIDRRFEEIVEFAGVGKFIDTPVKRYSSGMRVRLAFAVAAHLEPGILIIDEVLAVGDAEFQRKCIAKMGELAQGGGRTVLFVSHNLFSVQQLCPRSILLEGGRIAADGPTTAVIDSYLATSAHDVRPGTWIDLEDVPRTGSGEARFTGVCYTSRNRDLHLRPFTHGPVEFVLRVVSDVPRPVVNLAVNITHQNGTSLVNADTGTLDRIVSLRRGENKWRLSIEQLNLKPGVYGVGLWLAGRLNEPLDRVECAFNLEVVDTEPIQRSARINPRYDGVVACQFDAEEVVECSN